MAQSFTNDPPVTREVNKKSYHNFAGVDLTTAITEVDERRSPYAPNMIADESGYPCKRTGYEIFTNLDGRINGMHQMTLEDGSVKMIVHAGVKLYEMNGAEKTELYDGMADERSVSFMSDGKIYFLDGKRYLCYDGTEACPVDTKGYIPTTAISMPPEGGGEDYEAVNLLSPYRINSFLGKANIKDYHLDANNIDGILKCEVKDANGVYQPNTNYTVNKTTGIVTFATAPGVPTVTGEDNVKITYIKNIPEYANRINKCRIYATYGIGNDNRIFMAGNPDRRNYDYYSASGKADYVEDTAYSIVGSEDGAIMGYLRQYDSLVIVKEQSTQNATIFLRQASLNDQNEALFTVRQGIAGAGAASMYCFANLADDNVFLSEQGLMGLDTSSITMQRTIQNRSHYIDTALKKEMLKNAYGVADGWYYYIFCGKNVYIADTKQKTQNNARSFGYEWFYYTDIPARCAANIDGRIYFGDNSGNLYRFKNEEEKGMEAYSDENLITGEKKPIEAAWSTKMDRLGDASIFKRITKTGTGIVIKPYAKIDGTMCYVTDEEQEVKDFEASTIFDFDDVDFDNFNFGELYKPYFIPARKKKRKAKMWQMIVKNNTLNSAFGIYEIRVNYLAGGYIKR